jgi:predicted Ser/Thr protein kinase
VIDRFGRYQVVRELGRGAMGVVYVAHDPTLGRDVALKVVVARTDPTAGQRLLREAQAAARLQHPGIVVVLDVGLVDGLPYLAMELVLGPSLGSALRAGPLPLTEAVRIGAGLARALEHAHAQGVVHRDLKPANVLLAGPRREPKIVDFGLAKDAAARTGSLTATGEVLGTPAYMAPEQADGAGKRVDGRADVYALGATLHAMLTGEPPFQASSTLALLAKVLSDAPPRPSARRPGVSPALDALVLRCLEKEPARRPTAGELAVALEALARPRRGRQRRGPVAALAVVAVVAACAGVALLARRPDAPVASPLPPPPPLPSLPLAPEQPAVRTEAGWRWTRFTPRDAEKDRGPAWGTRAIYEPRGRRVLSLGGGDDGADGVWSWDEEGWVREPAMPGGRYAGAAGLNVESDTLVYAGGFDPSAGVVKDLWLRRGGSVSPWVSFSTDLVPVLQPAAVWSPTAGGLLLFGGVRPPGTVDGVLRLWDGDARWRELPATPCPPARLAAASCWDARRRRFVLFGGATAEKGPPLGDLWEWDGAGWREGPSGPPARSAAGLAFDGRRCLLVAGQGRADDGTPLELSDAWAWDGEAWTRLVAEGAPRGRSDVGFAWHPELAVGLLVGGVSGRTTCDDPTWTLSPPEPEPWPGPDGAWPEERGWRWRPLDAPGGPAPSDDRAAVHDPAGRRVLVLGGLVGARALDEVLAWDGRAWSSAGQLPEPRHAGVVALDPATGTLHYACGGRAEGPPLSDLWSATLRPDRPLRWETSSVPTAASHRDHASQLAGRSRPGFAWGAEQLVLFGGTTSRETLDDQWAHVSGSWTRVVIDVERRPPPRFATSTAWDAKRRVLVVFGGASKNLDDTLGDLWEWAEGGWTEGPRGPPARSSACLVYDGRRCLLVGGARSDRRPLDDAWAWDGTGWARLVADGPRPSPRARAALAWDAERRVALLVGGSGEAPCPDVAWELSPPAR